MNRNIKVAVAQMNSHVGAIDYNLRKIVKFINLSVEDRDKLGKNALNYYNQHFKKDKLLLDLENIFKEN